MHPPREWIDKWTTEHPRLALLVLAWGVVMIGFAVWLIIADWRVGGP